MLSEGWSEAQVDRRPERSRHRDAVLPPRDFHELNVGRDELRSCRAGKVRTEPKGSDGSSRNLSRTERRLQVVIVERIPGLYHNGARCLPEPRCVAQSNRDLVQIDIVASGHRDIEWPGKLHPTRTSKGNEVDHRCCPIRRDDGNTDRRREGWITRRRRDHVVGSPTLARRHGCDENETTCNLLKTIAQRAFPWPAHRDLPCTFRHLRRKTDVSRYADRAPDRGNLRV